MKNAALQVIFFSKSEEIIFWRTYKDIRMPVHPTFKVGYDENLERSKIRKIIAWDLPKWLELVV
ncbi:MAG: hypothetical protein KJP00_08475 [Bacteroidia bacterium]|nr:hypothetical protein [Bacteroidia bacterium]